MTRPSTFTSSPARLLASLVLPLAVACSGGGEGTTPEDTSPQGTATQAPEATATQIPEVTATQPEGTGSGDTPTPSDVTATVTPGDETPGGDTPTPGGETPTAEPGTPRPISTATAGDVIITELQPSPRLVSDSEGEWIEIHNVTEKTFDISSWKFSVQTLGDDTPETYVFEAPGQVLLTGGATAVIASNGNGAENGHVPADAITNFFLSGRGFTAVLQSASGAPIDVVSFDSTTWPVLEGHSIALSGDHYHADDNDSADSWCVSFDAIASSTDFGTPGAENPACGIDADGDLYHGSYDCADDDPEVNPGAPDVVGNSKDDDCDGDTDEGAHVLPGSLVITEFLFNPDGDDDNREWVEIYNTTEAAIDLKGFTFSDSAQGHVIPTTVMVPAGGYLLLGQSTDTSANGGVAVAYAVPDMVLNNSGTEAIRLSFDNFLVDGLEYSSQAGWSLKAGISNALDPRRINADDNDSSAYWCGGAALWRTPAEGECSDSIDNDLDGDVDADDDSCDNEGPNEGGDLGTPGAPNPQCDLDNDGDGFRPPLDCDDTNAAIYPGQLELPDNSKDDNCDGQTDEVIPPTQAVIITEIMYDPYPPSDNDGEYLELYNTTAEAIDLSGWSITDNANTLTVVGELILPANGYVVFVRTLDTEANGAIAGDYAMGATIQLNNTSEPLTLKDDEGVTVDVVTYHNDYEDDGWPNQARGVSVQLSSHAYNSELNDVGYYWCYSTDTFGPEGVDPQYGSPGTQNRDCRPAEL